jgi:hypothetical protein
MFSFISNTNFIKLIVFFAAILLIFIGAVLLFFSKYSDSATTKKIKECTTVKIILSIISGLIAWFMPWPSLKMLFSIIAITVLFSIFAVKRRIGVTKAFLIGFLILIVVLGIISVPLFSYVTNVFVKNSVDNEFPLGFPFSSGHENNRILPDSEMQIEHIDHITIDVASGIELEFTDGNILHYPSELSVKETDGSLTISYIDFNAIDTYVIKIGTAKARKLYTHCSGIKIRGKGNFKDFSLDCAGASINSDIISENDIQIDSSGLDINGSMKGKTLDIDCVGADIRGEMHFNDIQLRSTGTNIIIKTVFDRFDITSSGLNGVIEVLNPQAQNAELYVQATGGTITIDSKNKAPVEIESTGFVKINRK